MNITRNDKTKALHLINKSKLNYTKQITLAIVSVICLVLNYVVVRLAKHNQEFIEFTYSRKIFVGISSILNSINNIFPFSLSEVTYILLIVICTILMILGVKDLFIKRFSKALSKLLIIIMILCLNVLQFQITWGLNNYRYDIETLFNLENTSIEVEDLAKSFEYLVRKTNESKLQSLTKTEPSTEFVRVNSYLGYEVLHKKYSFINPDKSLVKGLLISPIFSSSGYTGIYMPLFSEANINDMVHISGVGFTASHELAHQKGFASEDEANFLGFLACVYQDDAYFNYSGYLGMMTYVGNSLYENDKDLYREIAINRSDEVINDIRERQAFWEQYVNETTREVHNNVNDTFLKANNQPDGIVNYSKVTELFVKAYKSGLFDDLD